MELVRYHPRPISENQSLLRQLFDAKASRLKKVISSDPINPFLQTQIPFSYDIEEPKMDSTFVLPNVDPFSGKNPEQSSARWFRFLELQPFTDASTLLAFVDTRLTEMAAEWADTNPDVRALLDKEGASWDDKKKFKERFLARWQSQAPTPALVDNTPLRQRKEESIPDFCRRVLARLQQVGGRDDPHGENSTRANTFILSRHLEMFRSGLKDERIAYKLGEQGPRSLEDACEHALKLSSFYRQLDHDPRYNSSARLRMQPRAFEPFGQSNANPGRAAHASEPFGQGDANPGRAGFRNHQEYTGPPQAYYPSGPSRVRPQNVTPLQMPANQYNQYTPLQTPQHASAPANQYTQYPPTQPSQPYPTATTAYTSSLPGAQRS